MIKLTRIHQPIGFFLLLCPTLWGLWFANKGPPNYIILLIFISGTFLTRSAGCIINDYIDQNIDKKVNRTKNRPLSSGKVNKKEALILLLILILMSAILVSLLNITTILLAIIALILSIIYPYLKRYTYYPQIMLGILFSWPVLMTFSATKQTINSITWLLFAANMIWTISYDTEYAMIDREDDRCIGIKSSAILFGKMDTIIILILQLIFVLILGIIGWKEQLSSPFYYGLFGVIILFIQQQILMSKRKKTQYLQAFLSNKYVGILIFIGIAWHFY